jgi:hypothetical protein
MNENALTQIASKGREAAPRALFARDWDGLNEIEGPRFNVAYLQREASLRAALTSWSLPQRSERVGVSKDVVLEWEGAPATCPLPDLLAPLPEEARTLLQADLEALLPRFARWTKRNHVRVHLSQVRDDACRKFHVDFIGLRTLITYVGKGTEWVESQHAHRDQVGRHDLDLDAANLAVVPDLSKVRYAGEGDVLVLKGEAFSGNRGFGAIHRSPPCSPQTPRLVLRVDVPQCGC